MPSLVSVFNLSSFPPGIAVPFASIVFDKEGKNLKDEPSAAALLVLETSCFKWGIFSLLRGILIHSQH